MASRLTWSLSAELEAIRSNPEQSAAISRNQAPSAAISRNHPVALGLLSGEVDPRHAALAVTDLPEQVGEEARVVGGLERVHVQVSHLSPRIARMAVSVLPRASQPPAVRAALGRQGARRAGHR